ncbi:WAS/WASL-interacting protein family member 1-like [Desmodus rotundus]|uniref:WAS/WASL-interacting protein family member 1-like n=1 Tax=Desmodus rotundus TaxID=9430 RepID=UPI0039E31038
MAPLCSARRDRRLPQSASSPASLLFAGPRRPSDLPPRPPPPSRPPLLCSSHLPTLCVLALQISRRRQSRVPEPGEGGGAPPEPNADASSAAVPLQTTATHRDGPLPPGMHTA